MKIWYSLILATFCASAAQAAWVLPVESMACSNDYNPWGHASTCQCPAVAEYNQKIGQCLVGDPYPITVSGVLHSASASKEGATLETAYGTFNLVVKNDNLAKLEKADGLYFEVSGEFVLLEKTPTIVVGRLSWLE